MRKYIFHGLWIAMVLLLVVLSFQYKDRSKAMVAQVENNITAISYQKPVRIKTLYVLPGQEVKVGDKLLEVERPDLITDAEKKKSELARKVVEVKSAVSAYYLSMDQLNAQSSSELSQLNAEKRQLMMEIAYERRNAEKIGKLSEANMSVSIDSVKLARLAYYDQEIQDLMDFTSLRQTQLRNQLQRDTFLMREEQRIIEHEIDILKEEASRLVSYAEKDGTIGNLFVQLNELVPPYQTIVSVYSEKPSLIKAFVNERHVSQLNPGASVRVESTNRLYSIEGQIVEIGARITDYPEKISPFAGIKSYGQEVFVRIPEDNNFLNGEKVYVYLLEHAN